MGVFGLSCWHSVLLQCLWQKQTDTLTHIPLHIPRASVRRVWPLLWLLSVSVQDWGFSWCRALDSFFPLVALLRLTFSVGCTSTSFVIDFLFIIIIIFCYTIWLINACWSTFIIVYSYMVMKVFKIQPFFISIICDLNFVNRNSSFRALSFSNSRSWCHVTNINKNR